MIQRLDRKNAVHNLSRDSPYITELVEHDILWTNDDLRRLSSVSNTFAGSLLDVCWIV